MASEVKALAKQTALATEEIGQLIGKMQDKTKNAVDSTKEISKTIAHLNTTMQTIATAVEQQLATATEIARSTEKASAASKEISGSIQNASSGADDTSFNIMSLKMGAETVQAGTMDTNEKNRNLVKEFEELHAILTQFRIES